MHEFTGKLPLVEARNVDFAGNLSVSGSFPITVDITKPLVPTFDPNHITATNDKKPTWTWQGEDYATFIVLLLEDSAFNLVKDNLEDVEGWSGKSCKFISNASATYIKYQ